MPGAAGDAITTVGAVGAGYTFDRSSRTCRYASWTETGSTLGGVVSVKPIYESATIFVAVVLVLLTRDAQILSSVPAGIAVNVTVVPFLFANTTNDVNLVPAKEATCAAAIAAVAQ